MHDLGRGGIVVVLRPRVGDIDVFHGDIKVLLDRQRRPLAITGSPHPAATLASARRFALDPAAALRTLFGEHGLTGATRLADGRVLITGNNSGNNTATEQMVADIYNPATNTWAKAGTGYMKSPRYTHVSGLLPDGRVIIAGGGTGFNGYSSSAEVFNPATNTFTTVASMGTARAQASSMIMPDGTFLVAGGYSGSATLATTQRYDGATNTWIAAGSMLNPHYGAVTEMLPGNYVLIAGGNGGSLNNYSSLSDQYSPLGALGASCGAGSECGSGFCVDGVCCDTACDGGDSDCRACSVAAGGAQNGVCGWVTSNVNACAPSCTTFQRGTLGNIVDTHIIAGSPTANFGTATLLSLGLSGTERQVLISADVSSIDPGANHENPSPHGSPYGTTSRAFAPSDANIGANASGGAAFGALRASVTCGV